MARFLSDNDVAVLQELINRVRRTPMVGGAGSEPDDLGQTPDIYIAKTPSAGIPAIDPTGTGTGTHTPGSADCEVYRITDATTPALAVIGLSIKVYNIQVDAAPGDSYVLVHRTKMGRWVCSFGSAGEGTHKARWIEFALVATLNVSDAGQADCILDAYHDGTDPDESVGTAGPTITVYNKSAAETGYCFAGASGAKGIALYDPENDKYIISFLEGPGKARWIEFTLPSALAVTDANKASCTVNAYHNGFTPGATVTVWNKSASTNYIFSGVTGDKGIALYDPNNDRYYIVQLQC